MPFKKGQSGNPHGRPAGYHSFKERAQVFVDAEGVEGLFVMARGEGEDRRFALKLLLEYAYGKPTQPISGQDGKPITIRIVDDDDTAEEAA